MDKHQQGSTNDIQEGMKVESTRGDLGENDVSEPVVSEVVRDRQGNVGEIKVKKGLIFKKELDVPADRVQAVEPKQHGQPGKVVVDAREAELEAMTAVGPEQMAAEAAVVDEPADLLEEMEEAIPTVEGLRDMEEETRKRQVLGDNKTNVLQEAEEAMPTAEGARELEKGSSQKRVVEEQALQGERWAWLRQFGPGFLGGMAGNDSSAVAAYSIDGAQNGFGHLWLMLLSTPLYLGVMYTCAKLGRITQKGMAEVLREHYGRWVALPASFILVIANVAMIAADLVAIGSGLELLTHMRWFWFVIPIAVLLWYLTVYSNFDAIKKIFIVMSLAFVAYFVTAVLAHPKWGSVLYFTFVPHIDLSFASISSAVALLGATISPYNIFWQVQGEKEEKRPGNLRQKLRFAVLDIATGVVSGNLIAYAIILSTASTLFIHHQSIATAADAAQALSPVLGPFAEYLFAIGIIGAGLVAIPVLLASTSYAVAGSLGWPGGLSKRPWQDEGFYLILTVALLASLVIALVRLDPIKLLFWANVLSGVLAPILVVYLFIIANNGRIMKGQRVGLATNIGLIVTILVMSAAAMLLFYGLFTGQG